MGVAKFHCFVVEEMNISNNVGAVPDSTWVEMATILLNHFVELVSIEFVIAQNEDNRFLMFLPSVV